MTHPLPVLDQFVDVYDVDLASGSVLPSSPTFAGGFKEPDHEIPPVWRVKEIHPERIPFIIDREELFAFLDRSALPQFPAYWTCDNGPIRGFHPQETFVKRPPDPDPVIFFGAERFADLAGLPYGAVQPVQRMNKV